MGEHLVLKRVAMPVDDDQIRELVRARNLTVATRWCNLGTAWSVLREQVATDGVLDDLLAGRAGQPLAIGVHQARLISASDVRQLHRALSAIPDQVCDRFVDDEAVELSSMVLRAVLKELRILVRAASAKNQALLCVRCPPDSPTLGSFTN